MLYLNFFCGIFEVKTSTRSWAREKVFNKTNSDIVAHSLQMFVNIFYVLKIFDKLWHQAAVG